MSRESDQHISRLLKAAARQKRCLAVRDQRLNLALKRRVATGSVVSPLSPLYADKDSWLPLTPDERALHILRGLQAIHPDWVFCHDSAAIAWGLPLPIERTRTVHAASQRHTRANAQGTIKRHCLPGTPFKEVAGVRVTPLADTVYSVLASSSFIEGLPVADRALRLAHPQVAEFKDELARIGKRRHGRRRVIGILAYTNPRSESWAESVARGLMHLLGFPTPQVQVELDDPVRAGRKLRVDMMVARPNGTQVTIEVDGMLKYESPRILQGRDAVRALADEQHREARLALYRTPILRLSYQDLIDERRFVSRLESYGIERSDEAARTVQRLGAASPGTSLRFTTVHVPDSAIQQIMDSASTGRAGEDVQAG